MNDPGIPHYDIGIHGGTLAGVAAALELKRRGLTVWLSSHRNYFGEDQCDPLRLILPEDLDAADPDLRRLFPEETRKAGFFRPLALKRELDRLLVEADIPVFPGSAPGEVFVDETGAVRGLSLCNRSGRRVLGCGVLVDATVAGDLLRLAGVPRSPPDRQIEGVRRVIGGEAVDQAAWRAEGRVRVEESADRLWA